MILRQICIFCCDQRTDEVICISIEIFKSYIVLGDFYIYTVIT